MAIKGGDIKFGVSFEANSSQSGLSKIIQELRQVQNQAKKISVAQGFKEAGAAAKQLESIITGSWNDKLNQLNLDKFNQSIKESYGSVGQLKETLTKMGSSGQSAFNSLASQVLNTNIQIRQSSKLLNDMATSMANTVKWGITSSIFNNITGTIQKAYYFSKDLDTSLNNIRIVTGDSADQMERFAKYANETAKNLGRSTLDYTKTALTFYQQGLSEQDVRARSETTLMAQNITGTGSQMADYLTSVWNGFKVTDFEQIQGYVDKLAKVADSSASNMSQLAIAMSKVASTANVMGVDVDQLNAQLATVIAVTRQAPESVGTAFKTIYTRLNDIQAGAEDAEVSLGNYSGKMAALGFNVLDTSGKLRDTGQVIEQIGSRWQTLSREQQITLAQTMGGTRQVNQVITLFDNWNKYTELLNTSINSQGTLLKKNNIYLESTSAHTRALNAQVEKTYNILSDTKAINAVVDLLKSSLSIFNDFIGGIGGGTKVFTYFGSFVAGIFNKQIAGAILNAERSFNQFLASKNIDKLKSQFAQQILTERQANKTYDTQNQEAINKAVMKQAQLYQKTLQVKKGLTQESYNELMSIQKQIGANTAKIDLIKNYKNVLRQAGIFEQMTANQIKGIVKNKQEENQAINQNLSWLKRCTIETEGLTEEERKHVKTWDEIKDKIQLSEEQMNDFEAALINSTNPQQQIDRLIKSQQEKLRAGKITLDQFLQALKAREGYENRQHENLESQNQVLGRRGRLLRQNAAHSQNIQTVVKAMSAGGQILSAWAGAAKTLGDELATAEEKANALFSGIQGSITGIGTMFGPMGMGVSTLINGALSLIKEVTPLGDKLEDIFSSTAEKIQKINEQLQKNLNSALDTSKKKQNLAELSDEFDELSKKAGSYGKDLAQMTADQQNRYHQIVNEIAELNPSIVAGYDEQGNAIIRNNDALKDTLNLLDEQYKKQMALTFNKKGLSDKSQLIKSSLQDMNNTGDNIPDQIRNIRNNLYSQGYGFLFENMSKGQQFISNGIFSSDAIEDIEEKIKAADGDIEKVTTLYEDYYNKVKDFYHDAFESEEDNNIKQQINNITNNNENQKNVIKEYVEQYLNGLNDFFYSDSFKQEVSKGLNAKKTYDSTIIDYENYLKQFLEWDPENNQYYRKLADSWGKDFEGVPKTIYNTLRDKIFEEYDFQEAMQQGKSDEEIIADIQEKIKNSIDPVFQAFDENTLKEVNKKREELLKRVNSEEGISLKQYNENLKKNIQDFINNNNDIKNLLKDSQTRDQGLSLLQTIFGISNLKLDEKNTVQSYEDSLGNVNDRLLQSIDKEKIKTDKEFFSRYMNSYNKIISKYTVSQLSEFEQANKGRTFNNFNQLFNSLQTYFSNKKADIYIKNIDKISSSISKLVNGKDLKATEKSQLKTIFEWDDKTLNQFIQKPQQAVNEIFNSIKQSTAENKDELQAQVIEALAVDLEAYDKIFKDSNIFTSEQKETALALALEKQQGKLKISQEELINYAKIRNQTFDTGTDEGKKSLYQWYQKQQAIKDFQVQIEKVSEDVDNISDEELASLLTSWNELTGSNMKADQFKNRIWAIAKAYKSGADNAEELAENTEKIFKAGQNPYQISKTDFNKTQSIYNTLSSGGQLSQSQLQDLSILEQENEQLTKLKLGSEEYLKIVKKIYDNKKEQLRINAETRLKEIDNQLEINKWLQENEQKYNELTTLQRTRNEEQQQFITQYSQLYNDYVLSEEQAIALKQQQYDINLKLKEIEESRLQNNSKLLTSFYQISNKLTSDNSLSTDQWDTLNTILARVLEKHEELRGSAEILKNTWLAGTDAYNDALLQIQNAVEELIYSDLTDQLNESINNLQEGLNDLQINVDPTDFENWANQVENFLDIDREITITVHTDAENEFDKITQDLDNIYNAAGKIGQNFIVAANDIRELNNVFPGIIQGMQMLDDGSYQLNSNIVQRAIATARSETGASAQTVTEQLKNQSELLHAKAQVYRKMADAAKVLASQEVTSDEESAAARKTISEGIKELEQTNAVEATTGKMTADEKAATSAKQSARVIAENFNQGANSSALSVYQFVSSAVDNFRTLAYAAQAVANNQIPQMVPTMPRNLGSSFVGTQANINPQGFTTADLPTLQQNIQNNEDISQETWAQLSRQFDAAADAAQRSANDIDGMLAQIGARVNGVGRGLNNVVRGEGINGRSEDNSNNNNNRSSTPRSGSNSPRSGSNTGRNNEATIGTPQHIDYLQEQFDRYHDIDNVIKSIDRDLNRIQKTESKLYGKDLIKNLNQQLELLEKQIEAYETKIELTIQEKDELKNSLRAQGVLFDANTGAIANYSQVLNSKLNYVNEVIQLYNSMSQAAQKEYKEVLDAVKQNYEDFKTQLARYDEIVTNQLPELRESIEEARDKQVEIAISKFNMAIEIELDLSKAQKDWNAFKKKVLNQVRDEDILGNVDSIIQDLFTYYNKDNNSRGLIPSLTNQVLDIMEQLDQIKFGGTSSVYGNNKARALEDLQKYANELMSSLGDVEDLLQQIRNSFYDMVDAAQEAFDEQKKQYDFLSDLIDHDKKLVQLLYGDDALKQIKVYNQKQIQTDKRELDFQKKQKDFWYAQMQETKNRMENLDKESNEYKELQKRFKELQQHWMDSVKSFNEEVEKSIQNLFDQYKNNVSIIFDDLGNKITSGKGLDYVEEEWKLINDNADDYLDKVNSVYEIQKLQRAYEQKIKDNEGNLTAQKSLNNLMNQQLKMLNNKDKLSKYDIDRANLLLQIEVKRLALEQSRNNKSKLRLRRDSQGNYSYQYVADQNQIDNAQQDLADAKNNLYNLDKNQQKQITNDVFNIQKQFFDKMKELYEEYPVWTEEAEAKKQLLIEAYENRINNKIREHYQIRNNLAESAFTNMADFYNMDVSNFTNMAEAEQDALLNNWIPTWNNGISQMADTIAGAGGLIPICQEAFEALEQNGNDLQEGLQEIENVSGVSFEQMANGIDRNIELTNQLIEDNGQLVNTYDDLMDAIQRAIDFVNDLAQSWVSVRQEANAAARAAHNYSTTEQTQAASAASGQSYSSSGTSSESYGSYGSYGSSTTTPSYYSSYSSDDVALLGNDNIGGGNGSLDDVPQNTRSSSNSGGSDYDYFMKLYSECMRIYNKITMGQSLTNAERRIIDTTGQQIFNYLMNGKSLAEIRRAIGFKSGGYTGQWGKNGKLGVLHEKQLILNAKDTENILQAVQSARYTAKIAKLIDTNNSLFNTLTRQTNKSNSDFNQVVHIDASFPAVNSRLEIEQAFSNLINRASQYAFNTRIVQ